MGHVERRHHRLEVGVHAKLPSLEVALEGNRVFEVHKVTRLRGGCADGDGLEALAPVGPDGRQDRRHVVLVAVHKEALQIPRQRRCQIVLALAVINRRARRAQRATHDEAGEFALRLAGDGRADGLDVDEPSAVRRAQVGPARRDAPHRVAVQDRHLAPVEGDGADEIGVLRVVGALVIVGVAGRVQTTACVPDLQVHAAGDVVDVDHAHQVVEELGRAAPPEVGRVAAEDDHLVARQLVGGRGRG